jgi:ABC-type sugar transport system ATPase subunit
MDQPFLELRDIGKTYPGVTALGGVSLAVSRGEVVGLIGENGAGKSTLMKVLGGVVAPSSGAIVIDGAERAALTVPESLRAGFAFVHQELNLFENLDVAANVFIGREPLTGGRCGWSTARGSGRRWSRCCAGWPSTSGPRRRWPSCRSRSGRWSRSRRRSRSTRGSSSWTSRPPA